ncbi:SET domain-containing protein-lysine N-methyltransferase [Legionella sp. PATHC035]|uniref:SET domain-containing protein n=1 Tax=Legionella sp. PATHC035 TaxID=2992040 RepID=UPI0022433D75|nr:SET domain-containing protein-lysine N-methyltransferase [Legionella sp. PATHC035]MCW8408990.1 SET domain-containing protein-lysine N-methyltransferase [Legionella sp. PATHC035]
MPKNIKFLNKGVQLQAQEEMLAEQLLFFPESAESQSRLGNYVKDKCDQPDFNYLSTDYDQGVIIAAIPNLGSNQLGVYAAKSFAKGEIVGEIKGIDLFGVRPSSKMDRIVKDYQGDSTYVWKLNLDDNDEYAVVIDMLKAGSHTRWVNHAGKPNLEVKVICRRWQDEFGTTQFDYHAYYVAAKKIAFAEELTISYGDEYFTKDRPQIWRQSQTLIEVLQDLAKTLDQEMNPEELNTREELRDFFNLLTQKAAQRKRDHKKQMYLDRNLDPKIYDLDKVEDVARFQRNQKMELKRNSSYHLLIAPTVRGVGEIRYSLFSGQTIPAKKRLCQLVGQKMGDVPEKGMKSWAKQRDLDMNYLVQSGGGGYLYTKNQASEAYCIEGAQHRSQMNVRFDFSSDSYVTTRQIQPGEEILAYYSDYDYGASPTSLPQIVADFNDSQYYYEATWSENELTMEHVIPKTPGYDVEETEDPSYNPFKEELTNDWILKSNFEFDDNERILTPGYDYNALEQEFSPHVAEACADNDSSPKANVTTWSPTFQFGENNSSKKRKLAELSGDEESNTLFI